MNTHILAQAITEVLNQSFRESTNPRVWKLANVPPLEAPSTEDFNKDLRPFVEKVVVIHRGE